jgi:hypothetical protein
MLSKNYMTGDAKTTRHRIITPVALLFHSISKKNNITENEARVWCVHEQNRQNQRHEDDDMKG